MPEVLTEKKPTSRLIDAFAITALKVAEENALAPFVGNANLMSGGLKLGIGLLSSYFGKSKFTEYIGVAFLIDGGEDIVQSLVGRFLNKGDKSASSDNAGVRLV